MKRILLDCDPGHDDMMAMMLACASDDIDLLGITTVAGNQIGEKTFRNALQVLTLIDERKIPVARGADAPLSRELTVAPKIHGKSGLDGAELPEADIVPLDMPAADFIIRTLKQVDDKITLVPTGPLTNIASVLLQDASVKEKIERIVLMGGALYDSNITPAAEFNIFVDPEAAKIVFESGLPITMIGLDVTNKAVVTFEEIENLTNRNGKISSVVGPLLQFFARANEEFFGIHGAPIHDALAVAYVIDPTVVETRYLNVEIETESHLTRGQTVIDIYGITGKEPNVDVALTLDTKKFIHIILSAVEKLDSVKQQ
jgi:inosine-uridine nucleoside N-ribohydrolase